jgi:hypothetical protein
MGGKHALLPQKNRHGVLFKNIWRNDLRSTTATTNNQLSSQQVKEPGRLLISDTVGAEKCQGEKGLNTLDRARRRPARVLFVSGKLSSPFILLHRSQDERCISILKHGINRAVRLGKRMTCLFTVAVIRPYLIPRYGKGGHLFPTCFNRADFE